MNIETLKSRVEKARVAKIRAEAAQEQAYAQLKELGFDSVEDAEAALEDLKAQQKQHEAEYNKLMADIERKYPKLMED